MAVHTESIRVPTKGRGTLEITREVEEAVRRSGIAEGLCTVFLHHTSASLFINENADPNVRVDLETFLARLVPDGDPDYVHTAEGADDMSAHVRTLLTRTSIGIPVALNRCDLGTWQGIYLWEHRTSPHTRRVSITVIG